MIHFSCLDDALAKAVGEVLDAVRLDGEQEADGEEQQQHVVVDEHVRVGAPLPRDDAHVQHGQDGRHQRAEHRRGPRKGSRPATARERGARDGLLRRENETRVQSDRSSDHGWLCPSQGLNSALLQQVAILNRKANK